MALIIASYEYEDPSLQRLIAPSQDAETLSSVLSDPEIGSFEVQTLLSNPSYKVNQAIEAFFTGRKRDDLLLLYFSGHGIKDEDGMLYFTTPDTTTIKTIDIIALITAKRRPMTKHNTQIGTLPTGNLKPRQQPFML